MAREMTADDLYREEVTEARAMLPDRKLVAGLALFDRGCQGLKDIICHHFPQARPETVDRLLAEILDFMQRRQSAL